MKYAVKAMYDFASYGRGEIISSHKSFDLAEKRAKKYGNFVKVVAVTNEKKVNEASPSNKNIKLPKILIIKTIREVIKLIEQSEEQLFIRWSRGFRLDLAQGKSRDYVNGGIHSGLSAVAISKEWIHDVNYLNRRITEYSFLRIKDNKIMCHIYTGRVEGADSDGYESITSIGYVASLSKTLINNIIN